MVGVNIFYIVFYVLGNEVVSKEDRILVICSGCPWILNYMIKKWNLSKAMN